MTQFDNEFWIGDLKGLKVYDIEKNKIFEFSKYNEFETLISVTPIFSKKQIKKKSGLEQIPDFIWLRKKKEYAPGIAILKRAKIICPLLIFSIFQKQKMVVFGWQR